MSPLHCEDLSKKFRGVLAVDRLTLEVPEGAIYALTGPNGAGKTTAIKTMMNILAPDSGAIEVLGVNSRRLGPNDYALIGYVSENQRLPEWMTVGYFMSYLKPFYPTWDDGLARELLDQFELPRTRRLGQLSRGMWMKASLASSLAYRPKLLILDEPFSGLDPAIRDEFIEGLLERAAGLTILVSSHDLAEIESFASHIGYLDHGRLRFSEEMTALAARFREVEVTLDMPSAAPPPRWPETWLRPEASPALVRFIDSQFQEERTTAQIQRLFPRARGITATPMKLREIFVALARYERQPQ